MALHFKVSPIELDKEQVQDYLHHCKGLHRTPSDSFFKHTVYGLRAACKVMGRPYHRISLPRIPRQNQLPIVLGRAEVKELIEAPKYLRHRLIIALLYGCGLRSYEVCNLKREHMDLERETIFVQRQKGSTDRYVPMGKLLKRGLIKYLRPDIAATEYLFTTPSGDHSIPLTARGVNWAVKEAKGRIKAKKKITAHTLRHSYATHLLENGVDLVTIKNLLGHAHVETTMVYLHTAQFETSSYRSPLDEIYGL